MDRERDRFDNELDRYCESRVSRCVMVSVEAMVSFARLRDESARNADRHGG